MSSEPKKVLPLDLWTPCYPAPQMLTEERPTGLHLTTVAAAAAYALKYPLLKARDAGVYSIELRCSLISGDITFGSLSADERRWTGTAVTTSRDGRTIKTFQLPLAAGEKFVLLVANNRPNTNLSSTLVIEELGVLGARDEAIAFASSGETETNPHHPIFSRFPCPEIALPAGFSAYFTGTIFRDSLLAPQSQPNPTRVVSTSYPQFDDEYFEWIALLCAVAAAEGEFIMIELGAGYGRWLMMGAGAARRLKQPFKLIGVEAEPSHFKWMEMCFRDNGIDPAEHYLIEAAVSGSEDDVWFYTGHAADWYGQRIAQPSEESEGKVEGKIPDGASVRRVRAINLNSILLPLASVDLIDLDIQGAEAEVLAAATAQLNAKVKMVSVSTHRNPVTFTREIEEAVTEIFRKMNWISIFHFGHGGERETPYGRIKFEDGFQVWVNPAATKLLDTLQVRGPTASHPEPTGNPGRLPN